MRQIVKVREVGRILVITLPKIILNQFHLVKGDRVMLEVKSTALNHEGWIEVTKEK